MLTYNRKNPSWDRWIRTGTIEHIVLFNKIFNGRGVIGREAQIVALNAKFENYRIEDVTSESDSEMEKHSAARKTKGPQFIIPPGYISLESTTTKASVPLNDINARATLTRRPRSRT